MAYKYKRRLLDHLSHDDYTPRRLSDLMDDLRIHADDRPEFEEEFKQLVDEGVINVGGAGLVNLPSLGSMGDEVEGTFRKTLRGFGFVTPHAARPRRIDLRRGRGRQGRAHR